MKKINIDIKARLQRKTLHYSPTQKTLFMKHCLEFAHILNYFFVNLIYF